MDFIDSKRLEWQCFHTLEDAESSWRKLMTFGNYRVFQSYDWVKVWFQTIGCNLKVDTRIVVATYDKNPVILIPLGIYKSWGVRRLSWLGAEWNDYNGPVIGDQSLLPNVDDIWNQVFELVGPIDLLEISKQAQYCGANCLNAIALPTNLLEDSSTHILDLQTDLDELRASIYSSRTWQGFERKKRKLEKLGKVNFKEECDPEKRKTIIDEMVRIKSDNLTNMGKNNPFISHGATEFLPNISHECPKISRVFTLRVDETVIATTFCLVEKNSLLLYQTSYNKNFGFASPGTLLLHHIIFIAAEEGYEVFDCLFGDEPYKLKICNRSVSTCRVFVAKSVLGVALKFATTLKVSLNRAIKKSPIVFSFVKKMKKLSTAPRNIGQMRS